MTSLLMGTSAAILFNLPRLALMWTWCIVILGFYTEHLAVMGLVGLTLTALALAHFSRNNLRGAAHFFTASTLWIVCALFYLHWIPGFANWLWIDRWRLAADSIPYSSYINLDKGLVGIALIEQCRRSQKALNNLSFLDLNFASKMVASCATIISVMGLALLRSAVRFDPKLPLFFPFWLAQNSLLTVVPEEALFRGFLLSEMSCLCSHWHLSRPAAIAMSSVVFGMFHFSSGWEVSLLATLAGLGYGVIAASTWGLAGAIALHTALNTIHFLGFSYPALAH